MFDKTKFEQLLNAARQLNLSGSDGTELNAPTQEFDDFIIQTTPEMIGRGDALALQEIHIFLGPVWNETTNQIDWELVGKYNRIVELFNSLFPVSNTYPKPMGKPLLALKFVKLGYLTVMQSSLYMCSNNKLEVIESAHMLANLFKTAGFIVLRQKIEASVHGITGIPQTNDETQKYGKYFEFHIRVEHKNSSISDKVPLEGSELNLLEQISLEYQSLFGIPVPLSFNRSSHEDGGYQRYLNVRFRNIGAPEALKKVCEIKAAINSSENLKVIKTIDEFVWYDTFVDLDKGWIDF